MNIAPALPVDDSQRFSLARRIIRASENPRSSTYKSLIACADSRTMRIVHVYPFYSRFCFATAERLTLEHLSTDGVLS